MIKYYKKATWFLAISSALYAILALTDVYFAGGLTKSGIVIADRLYIATGVMIIFPLATLVFYLMQYYYYRDKTTKSKLLSATWLMLFAILFLIAKPIDSSSNFLSDKRLISFISALVFTAIWITHSIQVFIK